MGLSAFQHFYKRLFDFVFASLGSIISFPFILLGILLISLEMRCWGLYTSTRVGKGAKHFTIYKIRTMRPASQEESSVTTADNPRITRLGKLLRKSKLDELPQLWNVVMGHMSLVGPRPDVPGFADQLTGDNRMILSVRPGITGPASLAFQHEEHLLAQQEDPERYNREVIWPQKIKLNKAYVQEYSFLTDLNILWKTIA